MLAERTITSSEAKQATCIEEEDYEGAEAMNVAIEQAKAAIGVHETNMEALSGEIESLKATKSKLWDEQLHLISVTSKKLSGLTTICTEELSSFKRKSKQTLESTEKGLVKADARCDVKLKSIERDEEAALSERADVETSISEEVGAFQEEMGNVSATVMGLESDVEDLRAKVRISFVRLIV